LNFSLKKSSKGVSNDLGKQHPLHFVLQNLHKFLNFLVLMTYTYIPTFYENSLSLLLKIVTILARCSLSYFCCSSMVLVSLGSSPYFIYFLNKSSIFIKYYFSMVSAYEHIA